MAGEPEKKKSVAARAMRLLIVGSAGIVTGLLCFLAIVGSAVQTRSGTVLPYHTVLLQWIAWILALPWILLLRLLHPLWGGDSKSDTVHVAVLLAFIWGIVVCWGLSTLLRWSDRRRISRSPTI